MDTSVPVRTEVVHRTDFTAAISLVGTVRAAAAIPLVARAGGRISYPPRFRAGLQTGVDVKAGELIAELHNDRLESASRQTALQLETANAEFDRVRRSYDQGVVSKGEYSGSKLRAALAREAFDAARNEAGRTRIVAPRSGTLVVTRPVPAGVDVPPDTTLAEIAAHGIPLIETAVPASQRSLLTPGLLIHFTAGTTLGDGRLAEVGSTVESNGTVRATAQITSGQVPPPGTAVELRVDLTPHQGVITVPDDSIVSSAEGAAVFVVKSGGGAAGTWIVHRVAVETGGRSAGRVEINSGLRDGDRVVVSGADGLSDDSRVTEVETK